MSYKLVQYTLFFVALRFTSAAVVTLESRPSVDPVRAPWWPLLGNHGIILQDNSGFETPLHCHSDLAKAGSQLKMLIVASSLLLILDEKNTMGRSRDYGCAEEADAVDPSGKWGPQQIQTQLIQLHCAHSSDFCVYCCHACRPQRLPSQSLDQSLSVSVLFRLFRLLSVITIVQ
eukprot:scpid99444/ scgid33465/ 